MKKNAIKLLICLFLFLVPIIVFAQDSVKLENPLEITTDNPAKIIGYVIQALLGIIGGVALVMMVYGGFQWLTAAGNEEKIKNGTQTMLWSAIGLVLVFSSYLLLSSIFDIFFGFK